MKTINKLTTFCWDLLFPVFCLGCNEQNDASPTYLCADCFTKIRPRDKWECAFCGASSRFGRTCPFCLATRDPAQPDQQLHSLDYLWPATDYRQALVRKALGAHKYRFIKTLSAPLSQLVVQFLKTKKLLPRLQQARDQLVLIPVPLHRQRLNWRSFNQSELLANQLGTLLNLPVNNKSLFRAQARKHQVDLKDHAQRAGNIKGVFRCLPDLSLKNKSVLLFDDVATSGSTLDECARLFKSRGASEVIGITIAKG